MTDYDLNFSCAEQTVKIDDSLDIKIPIIVTEPA